jgi:threonyl-tRNA synthetase
MQNDKQKEKTPLDHMRHSLAHLLGAALLKKFPGAKLAIGPAVDNGFYYDVDLGNRKINENDLVKIEAEMKKMLPTWSTFERAAVEESKARETYTGNEYKQELIDGIVKDNGEITLYTSGEFTDLCRGGHVDNMSSIDPESFKLDRLAGAYWRGDEKNKMLSRVYGLAFETAQDLQDYLYFREEAEKRDHKKLGKELGLYMFHETAPGMPYWLPKGLIMYRELENYWRVEHARLGYQEIMSPLVNKAELWKMSGHWDHYKDDMFIADMGDDEVHGIKPMNCPNAMIVFKSMQVSYKDLPLRLSDTDRLHRYERSGTLNGLLRCRSFQQDDAHNFISEDMIESEYESIMEICKDFYNVFGLEYSFRLGTRPEGFLGDIETWDKAEATLRKVLDKSGVNYDVAEGDGAFYGPKIDIVMKDALRRDWQLGTMQLDFQQPIRFNLQFTDRDGKKKTPVVVHRVIYGSLERFIGILVEHFAGAFPLWLSPSQVTVIPISTMHQDYANTVVSHLKSLNVRATVDASKETFGKRLRAAKTEKIPYVIVIGDKEKESGVLKIEKRGGDSMELTLADLSNMLIEEIKAKK